MTHNGSQSLDQVLEAAIVVSWADLMHGAEAGLIHIEYGFAPGGTLDYLKVWSSITRGHWLLACEYWMSASTFHDTGLRFDNGYQSEGLADFRIHHAAPGRIHPAPKPRPPGIASDTHAYGRGKQSGRRVGEPRLRSSRLRSRRTSAGVSRAAITFPSPLSGDRDAVRCEAGQYSARIFHRALHHRWGNEPTGPVFVWASYLHDAPFLANKMVNSDQFDPARCRYSEIHGEHQVCCQGDS